MVEEVKKDLTMEELVLLIKGKDEVIDKLKTLDDQNNKIINGHKKLESIKDDTIKKLKETIVLHKEQAKLLKGMLLSNGIEFKHKDTEK